MTNDEYFNDKPMKEAIAKWRLDCLNGYRGDVREWLGETFSDSRSEGAKTMTKTFIVKVTAKKGACISGTKISNAVWNTVENPGKWEILNVDVLETGH